MKAKLHQLHQPLTPPGSYKPVKKQSASFKEVWQEARELVVSKHAKERLKDRNISISDSKWLAISEKMAEAKAKGITDSLVVTNDAALVVSTKNNTVVTAMSRADSAAHIFTNINGTIVMDD
ncbi:flagellar protein [Halobacillus salinarum]|uniref:Flagellar protein n=1 Tax=Halobacillus salinarum TaxID=2932257 RepID=A0ABY4EF11_9BACI|nr:TIGR02530 family flagellar biosynthesis protein [Halobacillus salinarum]UOQ43050.1 flagellar protein [Halobacillus salinarum]